MSRNAINIFFQRLSCFLTTLKEKKKKKIGFRIHVKPHCVRNFHSKPPTLYSLLLVPAQVISPFVLIKLLDLGALCKAVNLKAA